MYWKAKSLNTLTNKILDLGIGRENNKSLSLASNNIPCDLNIPCINVKIVTIIIKILNIT